MTARDARDAVIVALRRAGLLPHEIADLDLDDVQGRRGLRPALRIKRRNCRMALRLDRLELVTVQAWLRHRGPRSGALLFAVHCDHVGQRPLAAAEVAQILERRGIDVRRRRARPVEVDDDASDLPTEEVA